MAPKKPQPLNKKDAKKVVEDKMFGMKNKGKSAKLKKMAQQMEASLTKGPQKGKEKKEEKEEEYSTYLPAQKVPAGVDPKTVLCMYLKSGQCKKGDKCKFSHDLHVEKKGEKGEEIEREQGKTEKICKHYIDALKTQKYGTSWKCPDGPSCPNKHSPPEGYSLKQDIHGDKTISLEEYIETERQGLKGKLTPMTEELFKKWLEEQERLAKKKAEEEEKVREGNIKLGKIVPSGKDLFVYNPGLFVDDEEALECDYQTREDLEDLEDLEEEEEREGEKEGENDLAREINKVKI